MKNRFNAIDVAAIVHDLRKFAVGRRLGNVYDINGKTYLFKFSGGNKGKGMVLIESGNRIHLTNHDWPKPDLPNGFAMKLRKHLRGSLLFTVSMLTAGVCLERVLDFDFGKYRLIVELYDHGNILLTTDDYVVVYALRPRPAVGQRYPLENVSSEQTEVQQVISALENELAKLIKEGGVICDEKEQLRRWLTRVLGKRFGGAGILLEHALAVNNLNGRKQMRDCFEAYGGRENFTAQLINAVKFADGFLSSLIATVKPGSANAEVQLCAPISPCNILSPLSSKTAGNDAIFEDFSPFEFAHLFETKETSLVRRYESFSDAVDEFFWKQEDSRLKVKEVTERDAALKRVENVRRDHETRIKQLQDEAGGASIAAALLEQNSAVVERALGTVRTAVTAGLSQPDIEQLLLEARSMGDPTAAVIHSLEIDKGIIKLRFTGTVIDVELSLTGILNTEKLWSKRRTALEKMTKTVAAAQVAIKNAERSIGTTGSKSLGELDERARSNRSSRRPFWFEQFAWFVSSDGRLVIAGRDHQQNELLVRRYMASSDIFLHCELHGAGVVLVKTGLDSANLSAEERVPPPPSTLREAAIFAVSRSVAWQEGTPAHAYWVWGNQVSKTPQTGEFITPGAFIIRGKRNILPLEPLVLGLGIVFVAAPKSTSPEGESEGEESDSSEEHQPQKSNVDALSAIKNEDEKQDEKIESIPAKEEEHNNDSDGDVWANVGAQVNAEVVVVSMTNPNEKRQQKGPVKKQQEPVHERPVSAPSSKQKQPTRGQKGKLKKIKEKYADQDEEEREARMALLQSAGNKNNDNKQQQKKCGKDIRVPSSAPPVKRESNRPAREPKQQQQNQQVAFDEVENEAEGDAKQRLNKQRHQIESALHRFVCDPIKRSPLVRFFNLQPQDQDDQENSSPSSSKPLLFALPVCAPYPSLSRCLFRVKIVPGKTKRGKVARATVEAWQRQLSSEKQQRSDPERSSAGDQKLHQLAVVRSLIKAVAEDEWSKNMPQSCKLMLSGAAQAAATEKAKRKNLAKKQKQAAAATAEKS